MVYFSKFFDKLIAMKLLALETSTENCSVALKNDDKVIYRSSLTTIKHAEIILPMVDEILKEACLDKKALEGIVLSVGPGSFTGVRVASSTAQGLALALNLKIAKVTSLKTLALEALSKAFNPSYIVSSIDARMNEVYIAVYKVDADNLELLGEEKVLPPKVALDYVLSQIKDCQNVVTCGSGIELLQQEGFNPAFEKQAAFPQAQFMLTEGERLFKSGDVVNPEEALPLYVRNEVTWKKVNEQH